MENPPRSLSSAVTIRLMPRLWPMVVSCVRVSARASSVRRVLDATNSLQHRRGNASYVAYGYPLMWQGTAIPAAWSRIRMACWVSMVVWKQMLSSKVGINRGSDSHSNASFV